MKKFVLFAGIAVCLGIGAREACAASTNALTVKFNCTVLLQQPEVTITKTASINTTLGLTKVKFGNQEMLNLLASEFHTTFPAGAQLGLDSTFHLFSVLDKAGNLIKDVSSNPSDGSYVFSITNSTEGISFGKETQTAKSLTMSISLMEPDFEIYYADGKGNRFHFGGLMTVHANVVSTSNDSIIKRGTLMIPGCTGGGIFLNPNTQQYEHAVFTGFWGATGANIPQDN